MQNALVIGGTGQIGLAVASQLSKNGWGVKLASRTKPTEAGEWRHVILDREDRQSLLRAIGRGADLVVDCIAFEERHADQLLMMQGYIGHLTVVSSASVYCDRVGRTLDEAGDNGFPDFPIPILENHPTVSPGSKTYSTKKIAVERRVLDKASIPVTVLRPCAIHGPYSKHAREWWFVKRLLDRRTRIPLAYGGRSRLQTTSVQAIAEAVFHTCKSSTSNIHNVVDGDAPTVAEIGRAVMAALGRDAELVGLPDAPYWPSLGATPWSVEKPLVCGSTLPATAPYAVAVKPAVQWLHEAVYGQEWSKILPQLASYPHPHFDYARDDEALALTSAKPLSR